jgi:tetratricopeptide (TPR) repeat protein
VRTFAARLIFSRSDKLDLAAAEDKIAKLKEEVVMTRLIRAGLLMVWLVGLALWGAPAALFAAQQRSSSQSSKDLSEADRLSQQADNLYREGRYDEAISLAVRELSIREKVLGANDPDIAISLNLLAQLYQAKGDYRRAEPLLLRALRIYEKAHGTEHPDTATALKHLREKFQVF